ncbi:calmodulin-binding-domain-containing protein [Pavlovales sp. CCMP2436]|nr:calmodulin-binding-domain-containing protein [Pavlovales sp. CCMP2436]
MAVRAPARSTGAASKHALPGHHDSGQVSKLLNPSRGVRDEMRRAGIKPANHMSENVRHLRQLDVANREKRSAAASKNAVVWSPESKNQKYMHVASAVARELAQRPITPRERPATAPLRSPRPPSGFAVGKVKDEKPVYLSMPLEEVVVPKTRKPAVPRRADAPSTPRTPRSQPKDFVHANIARAALPPRPSTAGTPSSKTLASPFRSSEQAVAPPERKSHHASFGALPKYLVERKLEMALEREHKEQMAEERKLCPPGTRLLAEPERLQTLAELRQKNKEVLAALQGLPLNPHTLSQKRHKADLEAKAKSISDALAIFERPRVVVADD